MQLATSHFGVLDIDESTIIRFPLGLPGFESCHRFKLLHEDVSEPKVLWLQSLDDPDLFFSVVEADRLGVNYRLTLSEDEAALLHHPQPEDLLLLLTLARPHGRGIRANTQSPILLNSAAQLALQKVAMRAEIIFTNDPAV